MNPYMYIFIREDLTPAQQIVQACHAVDELNKDMPHDPGNYMVLCGCKDEDTLMDTSKYLLERGIQHHRFFEPDVNGYTAIATEPLRGDERRFLKRFKLKS